MKAGKEILATKTNDSTVARIFLEHWVAPYGIPSKLFPYTGPKFVSKRYLAVCSTLQVNNMTTVKYHQLTNGQAVRFNSTLITQECHYIPKHQTICNTYLLPFTYAYYVPVEISIKLLRFRLALTPTPPGPSTVIPKSTNLATDDDRASHTYTRLKLIERVIDPCQ